MSPSPILAAESLVKTYGNGAVTQTVLKDVSFALAPASTCAIVGPSGSGKTTLIALCAGLERPTSGAIFFAGVKLNDLSEDELAALRNRHIGFVFQTFQLIPTLTALENVMVPGELSGQRDVRAQAFALLSQVGLEDRAHHYPAQLSGGEQQRVAIARAFINRPKILFADEPTANLDLETGRSVIRLLFALNESAGTTLVLVTHDSELTAYAERTIRLKGGGIVFDSEAARGASAAREAGR
ncbi:MAG TPA: ABC transporter ATP-binding protein [Candidatus Acidoferrales bacterium]|nr:ABC transporter ATP-binding protein [Candidatus Acidoferrales bacterium]